MMKNDNNDVDKNLVKEFSGSGFVSGTVKPGQPKRGKADMETQICNSSTQIRKIRIITIDK